MSVCVKWKRVVAERIAFDSAEGAYCEQEPSKRIQLEPQPAANLQDSPKQNWSNSSMVAATEEAKPVVQRRRKKWSIPQNPVSCRGTEASDEYSCLAKASHEIAPSPVNQDLHVQHEGVTKKPSLPKLNENAIIPKPLLQNRLWSFKFLVSSKRGTNKARTSTWHFRRDRQGGGWHLENQGASKTRRED